MSGPTPTPAPTPTPSSPGPTTSTPSPTPSPEPEYPPIPPLPDIPGDTYQRLLHLSSVIDSTSGSFNTSAGKVGGIRTTTNTAVGTVVTNSKGETTNALNDIWGYTQQDFTNAHTPLTSIAGSQALGGSPNQLQQVLDQHKADFQNGVPAVEKLRAFMASQSSNLTPEAVQGLVDLANGLIGALGNVNLVLQTMIMAIDKINGGISYACATGLAPGQPLPLFNQHTFAMESTNSGGGGGMSAEQLQQYLEDQGVDSDTALQIALYAEEQGIPLSEVQQMFDSMVQNGLTDPEIASGQIWELIENGSLGRWFTGAQGRNLSDVTALLNNNFSTEAVTSLLNQGVDLQAALADQQALLNKGVDIADINQWAQQGLSLKYARTLVDRGVSPSTINSHISDYLSSSQGGKNWRSAVSTSAPGIKSSLQRWASGTNLGPNVGAGHDGQVFNNRPQMGSNGQVQPPFPNPVGTVREYYVDPTGGARILVDQSGTAYYYPASRIEYDPALRVKVPFSYIQSIIGK